MPETLHTLAFATSADLPSIQDDDLPLAAALERLGVAAQSRVWNDPDVDWTQFDAVLIRTIWDYFRRYGEFLAWLERLDRLGVPTINPTATLRWNSDKRYLLELARHGAAIIPTRLAATQELPSILEAMRGQRVVVKPVVSGGAWHTLEGLAGDANFDRAAAALPAGVDYLVQPFLAEVVDAGEWSLLYFGENYSHAVIKRPAPGDYRVQHEYGGSIEAVVPDDSIQAAGARVLAAAAALGQRDIAYARVDGVVRDGAFLLMELELIEPYFYFGGRPDAPSRLAADLAARLARQPAWPRADA